MCRCSKHMVSALCFGLRGGSAALSPSWPAGKHNLHGLMMMPGVGCIAGLPSAFTSVTSLHCDSGPMGGGREETMSSTLTMTPALQALLFNPHSRRSRFLQYTHFTAEETEVQEIKGRTNSAVSFLSTDVCVVRCA